MTQLNEIKRMQQLAGILTESQLSETQQFSIPDILNGKHIQSNNPLNTIEDYKPGMKVVAHKFYGNKEELNQSYGTVTGMEGGKVQYKRADGKTAEFDPADLVIVTGQATESQLNEEEINFKDADQYADFLQNKTKELENSKIKLKIYDTFSNEDPEKEKFSGYITADVLKRTGGTGNLIYDATLIDNGGYKLLAPLKGKKISLTIPSTTGGNGGFKSEDPQMGGLFKVETFEFLDKPQAAPQAESLDPLDEVINNALKAAGIK